MIRRSRKRSLGLLAVAALVVAVVVLAAAFLYLDSAPTEVSGATDDGATVVWAIGDGGDGGDAAKEVADLIAEDDPDRLLYLGDVYETGTAEEFDENYDSVYGDLAEITEPVIGNHEYFEREEGYLPYWEEQKGSEQPLFYSFALGGWEIIGLNTEDGLEPKDEQLAFLEEELSERGTCRLPFWHTSRFSAIPDGDERVVEPFWKALRGRTEMVVSAHEHNMQRLKPIDGITQLVSGAGGHGLYDLDAEDPRLAFGDDETYGALRLELEPTLAHYSFVASDGEVLDEGEIACEPLQGGT
ncbi:MAG: metallophosphoesterase [Actinomycetota bacterium]|nr:metallophosphoesterase [Actinomycetota bacterium]